VANAIEDDDSCHPKWGKKRGSGGAGITRFSAQSLRTLDELWGLQIRIKSPLFTTYDALYRSQTDQIYPLPTRPLQDPRNSGNKPNGTSKNGTGTGSLRSMLGGSGVSSSRKASLEGGVSSRRESLASLTPTSSAYNLLQLAENVDPDDPGVLSAPGASGGRRKA
jgi:hypothetical protein